jgi:tetratricopeptide (TPR) repeat protein
MDPILTGVTANLIYDTMKRGVTIATDESIEDRVTRAAETVAADHGEFDPDHLVSALTSTKMGDYVEQFEQGEPLSVADIADAFRDQEVATYIDAGHGEDVEDVVEEFVTEIQSELAKEPVVWRRIVLRAIKRGNRDIERVDSDIGPIRGGLEDAYLANVDALQEAVRGTERQGFTWVTRSDFRDGRVDEDYCWQRAFTLAEAWRAYPLRRERPTETRRDDRHPAETVRDDRQDLTEQLLDTLADGGGVVLLGRPGSGKTTTTRTAIARWHERTTGGTVLYRRQGAQNQLDRDTLIDAVETARADGPVLLAVEDAAGSETTPLYRVVGKFETDSDVSFLLNASETEWDAFRERLNSLTGDRAQETADIVARQVEYLDAVDVPRVDTREVERYVENYEAVTDRHTTAVNHPAAVRDQVRAQHGVSPLLLLAHHVPVRKGEIDERLDTSASALVDNVREVFRLVHREFESDRIDVADEREAELLRRVALAVNVLNAAGVAVSRAYLLALGNSEDELETIDGLLQQLDGRLLFGRTDNYYRTHHPLWSRLYLSEHLQRASAPTKAKMEFTRCVNSLFDLLDDRDTRDRTRRWIGKTALLDSIAESPAAVADELVRAVFSIGRARPEVAPLFGTTRATRIDIPDHCSAETVVWTSFSRAKMNARRGERVRQNAEIDAARETYRERDIDSEEFAVEYHSHLGDDARQRGNLETARSEYEQAHEEAKELDNRTQQAAALVRLGTVARQRGADDRARERYETSRTLAPESGDSVAELAGLAGLGTVAQSVGNSEQARNDHRQSLERARELGDRTSEAICLTNLGTVVDSLGDHERARDHHRKSRAIFREVGHQAGEAAALTNLGVATRRLGDHERARRLHRESLHIARETGDPITEAISLGNLGNRDRDQGDTRAAMEKYRTASELFRNSGAVGHALTADANLSKTAVEADDPREAIAVCEQALELIEESSVDDLDDRARAFRTRIERLEETADSSARTDPSARESTTRTDGDDGSKQTDEDDGSKRTDEEDGRKQTDEDNGSEQTDEDDGSKQTDEDNGSERTDEDDGSEPFLRRECPLVQCGTSAGVDR